MNRISTSDRIGLAVLSAIVGASLLVSFAHADTLTRQLQVGMTGSDVGSLQTFLASDVTIYPQGLVTNYFGFLTKSAVSNWQTRNGIDPVGRVGPITLTAINAQMNGNPGADVYAPVISNVNVTSNVNNVVLRWSTNENAAGIVYYSTSYPSMVENANDVTISGAVGMTDTLQRNAQVVTIQNLSSNTTYYYVIYTKDATGNVQMTWPATFKTQ